MKAIQRAIWAAGDYDAIAELFWDVGQVVAEAAAIGPDMKVLDVATGTGNAAIRAAAAGAEVVGLDLTPELFAGARRREALAGVSVEWVEGDAEALPFQDASFDRVLSTFGVMFAPRHRVAAEELVRTCRPGGMIVLANWTPDGFAGQIIATVQSHLPPQPAIAQRPTLWGEEAHLRTLLGGQVLLALERPHRRLRLLVDGAGDEQLRGAVRAARTLQAAAGSRSLHRARGRPARALRAPERRRRGGADPVGVPAGRGSEALTDSARRSFRAGLRAGVPYALAGAVVALSFGVLARDAGFSAVGAIVMSAIVFAGSAQFAAISIVAAGGGLGAAIGAAALMNSRFLPMGIALAPSLRGGCGDARGCRARPSSTPRG